MNESYLVLGDARRLVSVVPEFADAQEPGWALVGAGDDRLLIARGPHVVELDVSDPADPVATGSVYAGAGMRWLRMDEAEGRAYGWGLGPAHQRSPVFDLRNDTLELRGQHDVSAWVSRQDAGRLSVSVQGGKVRVAEVLR